MPRNTVICIVDDDAAAGSRLEGRFAQRGYEVRAFASSVAFLSFGSGECRPQAARPASAFDTGPGRHAALGLVAANDAVRHGLFAHPSTRAQDTADDAPKQRPRIQPHQPFRLIVSPLPKVDPCRVQ